MRQRKLVLCVVDSLRTDMLLEAARGGAAPTFATLIERGALIGDCVPSFPSVTPVCSSEIVTGVGPDRHWISGSTPRPTAGRSSPSTMTAGRSWPTAAAAGSTTCGSAPSGWAPS